RSISAPWRRRDERCRAPSLQSSWQRAAWLNLLRWPSLGQQFPQADDVAVRIGHPGEMAHARHLGWWHQHLAAERAGLVEIGLQIIDMDIKRDVVVRLVAQRRDVAVDAHAAAGRDHRRGAVLFNLPVEELGIEFLRFRQVSTANPEMD